MPSYEVVTPRAVRKLIDDLAGKRAGYRVIHEQLARDPCAGELAAYRLSGPFEPIVCGVHLKRAFRLAFTIRSPEPTAGRLALSSCTSGSASHDTETATCGPSCTTCSA
jgi:hypothetical protein